MNILITGSRAPVALELSRRFHARGHVVYHADCLKYGMAKLSNSCAHGFMVPLPIDGPQGYVSALSDIVDAHQIDWLIPTCEEIYFIAAYRSLLNCRVLADDFEKLASIHNKWTFSQFASNEHATVPETILLNNHGDWQRESHRWATDEQSSEWVFKPVYSRFASRTLIGHRTTELQQVTNIAGDSWVAQRRIRGEEFSTYSIAAEGRLLAHATYKSVYHAGQGAGIYFQPVLIDLIEVFTRDFVAKQNFTGQIGFDFIRDEAGRYWVLEGNPRATSGAHLFGVANDLVSCLTLQYDELLRPSNSRPAMMEFAMPIWGVSDAVRRGRWWQFFPDVARARSLAFRARDPWPLLGLPRSFWEIALIARREKLSLQQAATFDIEWNGDAM